MSLCYVPLLLSVIIAKCHYAECRHAECRHAECRHAECRRAECRHAEGHYVSVIMLSLCCHYAVILLSL